MSVMSMNQQMATFFQMEQASGSDSQPPFTNLPQHDEDNEDEDDDEKYDDTHLDDLPFITYLPFPFLFLAYI